MQIPVRLDRSRGFLLAILLTCAGAGSASAQVAVEQICTLYAPAVDVPLAPAIVAVPTEIQYASSGVSSVVAYGPSTYTTAYLSVAASECPLATPAPPAPACIPACALPVCQSPQTNQKLPAEPPVSPAPNSTAPAASNSASHSADPPAREPNLEPVFIDPEAEPSSPASDASQRQNVARPGLEPLPPRPRPNAVRSQSTGWARTPLRREPFSPDGWRPVRK